MSEKNNKQATNDVADFTGQLKQQAAEAAQALDALIERQKYLESNSKQNSKSFQDIASKVRLAKEALEETTKQIDANVRALKESKNSLEQNQGLLQALKAKHDQLSKSKEADTRETKELEKQIDALSNTVSKQEKAIEKSKEKLDFHKLSIGELNSSLDALKKGNQNFGPVLEHVTKGFNMMKDGLSFVKTGFQGVGGAIKTSGFGLLVLVLQSVVEYFTKTKEGAAKLQGVIAAVALVVNTVKRTVSDVLSAIGKNIVDAFSNPAETTKKVWNGIIENLSNRFKAFGVILDGVMHFDLKKIGDGVIQAGTGVTNATDKIKTAYNETKKAVTSAGNAIVQSYKDGTTAAERQTAAAKKAEEEKKKHEKNEQERIKRQEEADSRKQQAIATKQQKDIEQAQKEQQDKEIKDQLAKDSEAERLASIARMTEASLSGYAEEVNAADKYFTELKDKYKDYKNVVEQLEKERIATLAGINQKYQDEELKKLDGYEQLLRKTAEDAKKSAKELAIEQINEKYRTEEKDLKDAEDASKVRLTRLEQLLATATEADKAALKAQIDKEKQEQNRIIDISKGLNSQKDKEKKGVNEEFKSKDAQSKIDETKQSAEEVEQSGHHSKALQMQIDLLNQQYDIAVKAAEKKGQDTTKIEEGYAKKKAALEDQLTTSRIHAGDKFINAALKTGKKDSAIFKAAFLAKKATAIADTIISTKTAVMDSLKAYSGIPFIGQALGIVQAAFMAAQGASSIAEIAKQKPGFAAGGQFHSDGRGALLPGYSRTDNTNAYLRSARQ